MSPTVSQLVQAVLALPDPEFQEFSAAVADAVDERGGFPLTPEWEAEIERRIAEVKSGAVQLVSWEEFQKLSRGNRERA